MRLHVTAETRGKVVAAAAQSPDDLAPQLILTTKWYDVLGVGGLSLVMAVIASFVPVGRTGRIDPVAVFQA